MAEMTPAEVTTILRQFNKWLRGNKDGPQLESREINQAINAAIEMIERLEAAEKSDAESLAMYRKARDERDTLRAKIEAMERQEPVGEIQRANSTGAYICSKVWVPLPVGSKLYALPGAKGE